MNVLLRTAGTASVIALSMAAVSLALTPVAIGATKKKVPTTKTSKKPVAPAKGQPGVYGYSYESSVTAGVARIKRVETPPQKPLAYVCKSEHMDFVVFGFTPQEEVEFTADGTRLPDAISNAEGRIARSAVGVNSLSTATICSTGSAGVTMRFVVTGKTSKKSLAFTVAGVEPVTVAGFDRTTEPEIQIAGPPFICVPRARSKEGGPDGTSLVIRTTGLDRLGGKTEIAVNGQLSPFSGGAEIQAGCRDLTGFVNLAPEDLPGDETYRITDFWTGRFVQFVVSQIELGRNGCRSSSGTLCDKKPVFPTA